MLSFFAKKYIIPSLNKREIMIAQSNQLTRLDTKEQVYDFMREKDKIVKQPELLLKGIKFAAIAYVLYGFYYILFGYDANLDSWLWQALPAAFLIGMYKTSKKKSNNLHPDDIFSTSSTIFYGIIVALLLNLYFGLTLFSAFQWISGEEYPIWWLNGFLAIAVYCFYQIGRMVSTYIQFSSHWDDYKKFRKLNFAFDKSRVQDLNDVLGMNFEVYYQGKEANYVGRESITRRDGRIRSQDYENLVRKETKEARAHEVEKNNLEVQNMLAMNQEAIKKLSGDSPEMSPTPSAPALNDENLNDKLAQIKKLRQEKES